MVVVGSMHMDLNCSRELTTGPFYLTKKFIPAMKYAYSLTVIESFESTDFNASAIPSINIVSNKNQLSSMEFQSLKVYRPPEGFGLQFHKSI